MPAFRSFVGCWLALFPVFAACGGSGDGAPATLPATASTASSVYDSGIRATDPDFGNASAHIARLIPANTAVFVQLQSFERFDALLGRLARAHDDLGRQLDELDRGLHRAVPGDERQVLPNHPIGIAVTFPNDREPEITFVLPIKDVVAYKRSLQIAPLMPQPVYDGSYIAVTLGSQYERSREPVALAADLPEQAVVVRVDLKRLDHRYGSKVRMAIASLGNSADDDDAPPMIADPRKRALLADLGGPLLYALAVGRQAEVSLDIGADRLQLRCAIETREAGVLAGWTSSEAIDLAPFARSLVASDSIALLGGCDRSVLADRLAPLLTSTPAERDRLAQLLESFAAQFGSIGALSGSLSHGESHFAIHVSAPDDPESARVVAARFELFARAAMGLVVESKTVADQEGVEVQDLRMRLDAASMCLLTGESTRDLAAVQRRLDLLSHTVFGGGSLRVRIATFGDRALIAIGNDEPWFRRTLLWAQRDRDLTPPDVRAALEHLGPIRAAAILRFDVARWTQGLTDWKAQWRALHEPVRDLASQGDTTVHAVDPRSLTLYLGAEGSTLRVGFSMGLASEATPDMARR